MLSNSPAKNIVDPYIIFPLRFLRFSHEELLLTNESGEYSFIKTSDFDNLINYKLTANSSTFLNLKGKHFITDTDIEPIIDMLAVKYRSKKAFLKNFTALHMVVITARCNSRCIYCHASSESVDKNRWDMSLSTAKNVVDIIFQTPSPSIKIEFQGGEALLNWDAIQTVIECAEATNIEKRKQLEFVLCTNLTTVTEDILKYLKDHNVYISTSLDGPQDLHDQNRILRLGGSTHDLFCEKLKLTKEILGMDKVSALMTTSIHSLPRLKEIIDEYIDHGFQGIFLRPLNPFGFAKTDRKEIGYDINEYFEAYKNAFSYIIELNLNGKFFEEYYAALLLTRILTPFSTGFMDLQFPSGVGIAGAIYDYDGGVYPSDEARMLAKAGDKKFLLGNVNKDNYLDIFDCSLLHEILNKSCAEVLPLCESCAFQMYCGSDPIRNYSEQRDIVGHRPTSEFCKMNMKIIKHLFEFLKENDNSVMNVFWSWITKRPLVETRSDTVSRDC